MIARTSQTATEYLIILAVVIVIGLIVVGVLGGIPSIGGGAGRNADAAELRTNKIGVMGHTLNPTSMKLMLRNNMPDTISLNSLTIEGTVCTATNLPVILSSGRQTTIVCTNVNSSEVSGTQYEYDFDVNYTDVTAKADYEEDDLTLVGVVSGSAALSDSGSGLSYTLIEDDTEDAVAETLTSDCVDPANATDEDWNTAAEAPGSNDCVILVNYTLPSNVVSAQIEIKQRGSQSGFDGDSYTSVLCYNGSTFQEISSISSVALSTDNISLPISCILDPTQFQVVAVTGGVPSQTALIYEEKVWWNVSS